MGNEKTNYFIVAIVAIVAIVGLIVLYMYTSGPKAMYPTEGNVAGQAYLTRDSAKLPTYQDIQAAKTIEKDAVAIPTYQIEAAKVDAVARDYQAKDAVAIPDYNKDRDIVKSDKHLNTDLELTAKLSDGYRAVDKHRGIEVMFSYKDVIAISNTQLDSYRSAGNLIFQDGAQWYAVYEGKTIPVY